MRVDEYSGCVGTGFHPFRGHVRMGTLQAQNFYAVQAHIGKQFSHVLG